MTKFLITLFFSLIATRAIADSPPAWKTQYAVESANKMFTAEIEPKEIGAKEKPWEWKFQVTVRRTGEKSKVQWKQEYHHTGYSNGMLSNDGNYYVYVESWYYPKGNLITVYSANGIKSWSASDLSISRWWLPKTASHRLWLQEEESEKFIEKNGKTIGLHLSTRKGPRDINF